MSNKENLKITFYNREDNEALSDQYSESLMINRDGEVFELVHNGRGEYNPSYEGDWIGYKINGSSKTDEYEAKAKAFDEISFVFVDSLANDYDDHSIVQNIAKVIEYESGGSDE